MFDGTLEDACRVCRGNLDVIQPDTQRPERLLAVCVLCSSWHYGELGPDPKRAIEPRTLSWRLIEATIGKAVAEPVHA
jgi:hypothetical protein